jgi:hypothetical protein
MIIFLVGPEEVPFTLHQIKVCAKSKLFQRKSREWLELEKKIVRLPDLGPNVFKEYWNLISKRDTGGPTCTETSQQSEKDTENALLIDLYLLGLTFEDVGICNKAVEKLYAALQNQDSPPSPSIATLAYESTNPGSLLRKMMVDVAVGRRPSGRRDIAQIIAGYPSEMVQDIAMAALHKKNLVKWENLKKRIPSYMESEDQTDQAD